jgi:Ni,Fe-hydrogenase III large subunit/Ni,Fe-hydrogenase III component G
MQSFFEVPVANILTVVTGLKDKGLSLKVIDATDERDQDNCFKVWYVFGSPQDGTFTIPFIRLKGTKDFPSVAAVMPVAGWYERRIKDFFGLNPVGGHDTRRLVLHENWPEGQFPLRKDFKAHTRPDTATGTYEFHKVNGEGIYEIPVGPIHAGIIEPGHFRFSMAGESIMLLEARLGYVHKGHEKLFEVLPLPQKLRLSEKISGDSSFSHSLAFCQAAEQLADIAVPARGRFLRVIYAELERLACHIGDVGFIMLDAGFNFGGANGQRLREMVMRINGRLTGSRFLRGVNVIGGVSKDLSPSQQVGLASELAAILKDFTEVIDIAEDSASLLNRLKTAGPLSPTIAKDFGAVGVAARAVGIATDARAEYPYAAYAEVPLKAIALEQTGDVYARFHVRIQEIKASVVLIKRALQKMPAGKIAAKAVSPTFKKDSLAVGCVEGWRGEIIHVIRTNKAGEISRVIVRDPSRINWQLVGYSGQGQIVPDFPLINKSYNLSYTGNDL